MTCDALTNESKTKGTICVELALQALNIGQKVDNIVICVVLLGSNAICNTEHFRPVAWAAKVTLTLVQKASMNTF